MRHVRGKPLTLEFASVELGGVAYAIVPAAALLAACRKAGIQAVPREGGAMASLDAPAPDHLDAGHLPERIAQRRQAAGLTQAQLAQRAGVRVETVNRIERGHVTPDFGTIRKLVQAMQDVERAAGDRHLSHKPKEKAHVS